MNIYIENEYDREIDVDYTDIINKVVCQAVDFIKCPYECEVNVTIVDNNTIHEINREQRKIDRPTDVLSFPMLEFDEDGNLEFKTEALDADAMYDEIGSVLRIKQIRKEKQELLASLEMYYRVFFLGEEMEDGEEG